MDPRVCTAGQKWPALNMSRSFGDLESQCQGVIAEPTVGFFEFAKNDSATRKIVICTDGVWDVITPEIEVAAYLGNSANLNDATGGSTAAERVCTEAKARWNQQLDDGFHDDITCVVVDVDV